MIRISAVLLMFGLATLVGEAQDLGSMAREQREVRSQRARTERKITTETATAPRPGSSLSVPGVPTPRPTTESTESTADSIPAPETPPADADTEASDDPGPSGASGDSDETEEAWRARFAEARTEIERSEQRLELSELELGELRNQLLTRSDIYNREYQLAPAIAAKEQEVADNRVRLVEANQVVDDLRTELREAGLPPGWGR